MENKLPIFNDRFCETQEFFDMERDFGNTLGKEVLRRLREDQKTGTDLELSENNPLWQAFKVGHGYAPYPLQMTGELLSPSNWDTKLTKEGGQYEANQTVWNKWIELQNYRDSARPDANWNEAFLVSDNDVETAEQVVDHHLDRLLESFIIGGA